MGLGLGIGLNDVAMRGGAAFPSLNLDSNNGSLQDQPFVNLSRSSQQTYFDSNGVLQTAPANSLPPSYEYNPIFDRWERKGWYIGESRENKFLHSEEFDDITWDEIISSTTSIDIDTITAPDDSVTADKIIESNSGNTAYGLEQTVSLTNGNTYTLSIFSKSSERDFIRLFHSNASTATAWFNLSTGSVGTTQGSNFVSADIKQHRDGWYRCSMTFIASSNFSGFLTASSDGVTTTTGDGTSGIYIWGAQLEEGSFPSPYIPTTGSTVTRSATLADITDLSWYNQDEGTFVVETYRDKLSKTGAGITLINSFNLYQSIYYRGEEPEKFTYWSDDAAIRNNYIISHSSDTSNKYGFAYNNLDFTHFIDGDVKSILTATFGLNPTKLELGVNSVQSVSQLNGYIKSLKYYPKRLSNSQLQSLTNPSLEASLILEA